MNLATVKPDVYNFSHFDPQKRKLLEENSETHVETTK